MPKIKYVNGVRVKISGGEGSTFKESFTLSDLKTYWESRAGTTPLAQVGDEAVGSFNYLLQSYTIADVLWSIDHLFKDMGDRPEAFTKPVKVFDLTKYLEDDQQETEGVGRWLR